MLLVIQTNFFPSRFICLIIYLNQIIWDEDTVYPSIILWNTAVGPLHLRVTVTVHLVVIWRSEVGRKLKKDPHVWPRWPLRVTLRWDPVKKNPETSKQESVFVASLFPSYGPWKWWFGYIFSPSCLSNSNLFLSRNTKWEKGILFSMKLQWIKTKKAP